MLVSAEYLNACETYTPDPSAHYVRSTKVTAGMHLFFRSLDLEHHEDRTLDVCTRTATHRSLADHLLAVSCFM